MRVDEVMTILQGIDGFYSTKITHPKYGDVNLVKHWTDKLSKLPLSNCQKIITSLEEASLHHKKPSAPSLGMFLSKYNTVYTNEEQSRSEVLKSDCEFCRNGRATVVYAGDHTASMAIISSKDGLCMKLKPRNDSGIYNYYRTERIPCSRCDKGFKVNDYTKYDQEKLFALNDHAFQNDDGAAVWFAGKEFNIPYFVKYVQNNKALLEKMK